MAHLGFDEGLRSSSAVGEIFGRRRGASDAEKVIEVEQHFIEESPYESVRAAVRNTNGGEVANTLRAWVVGFVFVTIASGINMFLSMRNPAIVIPTVVILLLVYPIGCLGAKVMPTRHFNTLGITWSLNTGPFNIKEHAVVTLMANVTYGYAYSTDALIALQAKPLFNLDLGWGFALLFTLSSQVIGIAIASLFRRFNVWPAALIWPQNLSVTTLLYALHDKSNIDPPQADGWSISQYRYYLYVTLGAFIWYWFPGVIWQGLSVFSFVTWIRPNNVVLNQLFGGFYRPVPDTTNLRLDIRKRLPWESAVESRLLPLEHLDRSGTLHDHSSDWYF